MMATIFDSRASNSDAMTGIARAVVGVLLNIEGVVALLLATRGLLDGFREVVDDGSVLGR